MARSVTCSGRRAGSFAVLLALSVLSAAAEAGEHPCLFLCPGDVARVRQRCGIEPAPRAETSPAAETLTADYQAVRGWFGGRPAGEVVPGELMAAAFLHLVDPGDPAYRARLQLINSSLQQPAGGTIDLLELIVALDWCWNDLDPGARREFLLGARKWMVPLGATDSPLDPRRFRQALASVALAVVVGDAEEASPSWLALREGVLAAAQTHLTKTFPVFLRWRGLSPTGPAAAAEEELTTALAVELAGLVLGREAWHEDGAIVGRWLEHYVFALSDHPAVDHNFVRDDAGPAPLTPAVAWRDLLPVTAHLIAARTGNAAAAWVADRVEAALRDPATQERAALWRWVPIMFDLTELARCDTQRLPTARNLGGAVVFRGCGGVDATAIWIDAAQPFLRRGQHFDAGHFLIRRGGQLTVGGGDEVGFEAIPGKGGSQQLGNSREPFNFEQYSTATIAHNAVVLWDSARTSDWYGQPYLPAGGQRPIEGTCTDFVTSLESQGRLTGVQRAYGFQEDAAYLALDLSAAYEKRAISAYTREFVFLLGRALLIVDRLTLPTTRSMPTWVLNLPTRPQADGSDLEDAARVAGSGNDAGIWRYDGAKWLHWTHRDGGLWLRVAAPETRVLRVVGGPARRLMIKDGPYAGQSYVGGEPESFERLIIPGERRGARNAWYRLGAPTLLGTELCKTPHWGRIEVEPAGRSLVVTFVTLLVTDSADGQTAPDAEITSGEEVVAVRLRLDNREATLHLPAGGAPGGRLAVSGAAVFTWDLPRTLEPDRPLAERKSTAPN